MNLVEIILRLFKSVDVRREVVVSTSNQTLLSCLIKVVVEVFVKMTASFRGFNKDKGNWFFVDFGICHFLPVYFSLMMAHVYAVNAVASRIFNVAIQGSPSSGER